MLFVFGAFRARAGGPAEKKTVVTDGLLRVCSASEPQNTQWSAFKKRMLSVSLSLSVSLRGGIFPKETSENNIVAGCVGHKFGFRCPFPYANENSCVDTCSSAFSLASTKPKLEISRLQKQGRATFLTKGRIPQIEQNMG